MDERRSYLLAGYFTIRICQIFENMFLERYGQSGCAQLLIKWNAKHLRDNGGSAPIDICIEVIFEKKCVGSVSFHYAESLSRLHSPSRRLLSPTPFHHN